MSTNAYLSVVDLLIFSAPEGVSPFIYAANYIAHIMPDKPGWYYKQIIVTAVLYALSFLLSCASFVAVARRGKQSSSLWLFRTHYGHSSRIPYIMPNPLTMFLGWNIIFSLLMQPYTWLPASNCSKYGFVFIFDGIGIWTWAFGTLYAILLPRVFLSSKSRISTLLHPILLNAFCFGMPVLLFVTQLVTATLSQVEWNKLVNIQFELLEDLQVLSEQWVASNGTTIDPALRSKVSVEGTALTNAAAASQNAFVRNTAAACAWYFLCLVLFAPTAIWLLLTMKGAVAQLSRDTSTPSRNAVALPSRRPSAPINLGNALQDVSRQRRAVRRAYISVALQFLTTFICLVVAVSSFLWVTVDINRVIASATAHAIAILLSDWVLAVVGVIVNTLILVRMTAEVDTAGSHPSAPSDSRKISRNSHTPAENSPITLDVEMNRPIPLQIISNQPTPASSEFEAELRLSVSDKALLWGSSTHSSEIGQKNNQF
ncbi:Transmembrane protein [Ceratobasidium theobromae]|uniref:Transmembrane protein n=1 Tax=Ceratobasidium theobromae TaxID=1582974 RepID=A0A5N5QB37_9AGAM|nr:Transmembrane protein [Ceratobasidium theobromae]